MLRSGYLFALAALAAAVLLRLVLLDFINTRAPFFPFTLAVLVTACYGGLKPGLLVTALGTPLGVLLATAPTDPSRRAFSISLFVISGVAINVFCEVLHITRRRLELADRHKDVFLATLAHELRGPLAPIHNAVEILGHAPGDAVLVERMRGLLARQVGQLERLVEDLLDVSRIASGKLQLRKERVELAAVVRTAVEEARPRIDAQAHTLTVTLPEGTTYLDADAARLAQIVSNLLINAAKYTPREGHINLSAGRDGKDVVLTVKDDGIGLTAVQLPRVFRMFEQLERGQGGLGIGLALVKGLVEMHGGRVEAKSAGAGKGSEFVVRLPGPTPASATAAAEPVATRRA
jgi:signal transduction histidine kinase